MLMMYAAVIDDELDLIRFEKIYNSFRKQMIYAANEILHDMHESEDAVQNAFLGIAKNISSLPCDNKSVVRAYCLISAKNAALNMLPKKERRDATLDIDDIEQAGDDDVFTKVALSDDKERLRRAIDRLPALYKDVLFSDTYAA